MAELPRTPIAVWRDPAEAIGAQLPDVVSGREAVRHFPELLTVDDDSAEADGQEWVSFLDG